MDDTDFHREQLGQFQAFAERIKSVAATDEGAALAELAGRFVELADEPGRIMDEAPPLVARMLTTAPQLAPEFPRDLLWYLGAECLHFMPDEEIERYHSLDEDRRAAAERGETFNWREARAAALKLQ